jgi:hypothetical protein
VLALTTEQAQALTTDQVVALTTRQVQFLTTAQVVVLTTDQIRAMETRDVAALTGDQIPVLTTAQINKGLSTDDIVALSTLQVSVLTTDQVQALRTDQVVALSTRQVQNMTSDQIAALTTDQIRALETRDVAALSTTQVAALTSNQVCALSSDQHNALSTDQLAHLTAGSPIILDLNGDGISTRNLSQGVAFDLFGIGQDVRSGWVGGGDGLLVLDRNGDGLINNGTELFGQGTRLQDGQRAANGYAALAELDSNLDGVLNASDADFSKLQVWVDANTDGISNAGEVRSLKELGITALNLSARSSSELDNGNLVGLISSYTSADGSDHAMADVWFQTAGLVAETAEQPAIPLGFELVLPDTKVAPLTRAVYSPVLSVQTVAPSTPSLLVPPDSLPARVSGMVNAMAAYVSGDAEGGPAVTPQTLVSGVKDKNAPTRLASLQTMVDAMKTFDANGRPLAIDAVQTPGLAVATLESNPLQVASSHAILVAPR